jgi:tRNA splicing ligase
VRRENAQITKIRNNKEDITTNIREIQGLIRDYFENLYYNKFENLEEMENFLDNFNQKKKTEPRGY